MSIYRRNDRGEITGQHVGVKGNFSDYADVMTSALTKFLRSPNLKKVKYNTRNPNLQVQEKNGLLGPCKSMEQQKDDTNKNTKILIGALKRELDITTLEEHIGETLFQDKKCPNPNTWMYHPRVDADIECKMVEKAEPLTQKALKAGGKEVERSAYRVYTKVNRRSIQFEALTEEMVRKSKHKILVEISSIPESFNVMEFKKLCSEHWSLADVYTDMDIGRCTLPGGDSSKRCRALLSKTVSSIRLSRFGKNQAVHPSIMLRCVSHVLHALTVLHKAGYVHGAVNAENVFVNFHDMKKAGALEFEDGTGTKQYIDVRMCGTGTGEAGGAGTFAEGKNGIQFVLGGYNKIRKLDQPDCQTNDDIASAILMFAQEFGEEFLHFYVEPSGYYKLFPYLRTCGYVEEVVSLLELIHKNGPRNLEFEIRVKIRDSEEKKFLEIFTEGPKALHLLCGKLNNISATRPSNHVSPKTPAAPKKYAPPAAPETVPPAADWGTFTIDDVA